MKLRNSSTPSTLTALNRTDPNLSMSKGAICSAMPSPSVLIMINMAVLPMSMAELDRLLMPLT